MKFPDRFDGVDHLEDVMTTPSPELVADLGRLSGDILIHGRSIVHSPESEKDALMREFGVLYQSGALFSSLSLHENVALPLKEGGGGGGGRTPASKAGPVVASCSINLSFKLSERVFDRYSTTI